MGLVKAARKLVPKVKNPPRQAAPVPKKKPKGSVNNPEDTPQEPKGIINKRALARQVNKGPNKNAR
ncbi:MAG: hypothetical protein SGI88_20220 [Candidatus Hydrogenedentes bacterium]|nr:hypothetical protein [Candidatus Hydrogenedentota bacterium]